jgi:hypothetical protein
MNELTVISPKTLAEASALATQLSAANSMPQALKKSPADVLAIVLAGAELGLAPMQAIRGIALIDGKPNLSADAMGALVRASSVCEYLTCVESTDKIATFATKRRGAPSQVRLSFTIEEARLAELAGKGNWKKYPKAMLRARALSAICRLEFGDLMLGVYDPDELEPVREAAPSVADKTEELKSAMKIETKVRRMNIVDVSPTGEVIDNVKRVGWGKNANTPIAELTKEQLDWYINDAKLKGPGWEKHLARYSEESNRRATDPEVTP